VRPKTPIPLENANQFIQLSNSPSLASFFACIPDALYFVIINKKQPLSMYGENMSKTMNNTTSPEDENMGNYETIRIEKISSSCSLCEEYAQKEASKPIAVLSCEGACLRGEISRRAANQICFRLAPEETVRICLGGAFTKDTGQRNLVRNASRVIAIEGCFIRCASRMMQGALVDLQPEVIIADTLYDLDGDYFGINDVPEGQIQAHADTVASKVFEKLNS
jgi:uncharacterized metal-binding protein